MKTLNTVVGTSVSVALSKVAQSNSGTASLTIKKRDDGKDWGGNHTKSFSGEETDFVKTFYRLGSYRQTRQYEFDLSDVWPFAIQSVEQQ